MDVNLIWNLRWYKETIKGYTLFIGVIYVSMACFVCLFIDFSSLLLLFLKKLVGIGGICKALEKVLGSKMISV